MKRVALYFVVEDDSDVAALNAHIEESGLLNEWPVYGWETTEATEGEAEWYTEEYAPEIADEVEA